MTEPLCAYPGCGLPESSVVHSFAAIAERRGHSFLPPEPPAPSHAERLDALERAVDKFGRELFLLQSSAVRAGLAEHAPELKKRTASPAPEPKLKNRCMHCLQDIEQADLFQQTVSYHMRCLGKAPEDKKSAPEPKKPIRQHRNASNSWHDVEPGCCLNSYNEEFPVPGVSEYRDKPEKSDAPEPPEPRRLTLHRHSLATTSGGWEQCSGVTHSEDGFETMNVIELTEAVEAAIAKAGKQ